MNRPILTAKLPLYAALVLLTQCSKCKDDVAPLDQLPPATQTGANTFGCLVNGQAWTPNGRVGLSDNLVIQYEASPTLGGNLNISAFRYSGSGSDTKQAIKVSASPIFQARSFSLDFPYTEGSASYYDRAKLNPCNEYFYNDVSYRRGTLTLTKLDEQAGIIAGTFEFTVTTPGCDTVRVTQGRFDAKF